MLLTKAEQRTITFVRGELAGSAHVLVSFREHSPTHVIHLAALQVPFCRANPVLGAQVDVVGTVYVFEAARQTGLSHMTHASSAAVYGPPENYAPGSLPHTRPCPLARSMGTTNRPTKA